MTLVVLGTRSESVQIRTRVHAADRADGPFWMDAVCAACLDIAERCDVLPAKDLLRVDVSRRWPHLAVDHRRRLAELRKLVAAAGDEREVECTPGEPAGTSD